MEKSPDRTTTRIDLAKRLGVSPRTVVRWIEEGLPIAFRGSAGRASKFDEAAVRAWLQERGLASDGNGSGSPIPTATEVSRERARKERAQALLAEQLHQTRAKTLLPADEVEKVVGAKVSAARTVALTWKTALIDRLELAYTASGREGMQGVLDDEVDLFLRELAGGGDPVSTARPRKTEVA